MVSPLQGLSLQGVPDQTAQSILGGRQAYERSQLNQQSLAQGQQQLDKGQYDQAVQRLTVINKLATKAKSLGADQRYGFVQSINPDLLKSVGIDPAQVSSVQLDDNSLDALIAQTSAAIPQGHFRKESVNTDKGLQVFDPSTGTYTAATGTDGKPLVGAAYDPTVKGNVVAAEQDARNKSDLALKPIIASETDKAKAGVELATKPGITKAVTEAGTTAEITAKNKADAEANLPVIEDTANNLISSIDGVLNHPGRKFATGGYSMLPVVPGTSQADFVKRMDQINGQSFLQAYQSLKGSGAITDIEGKKAGDSINRMSRASSDSEFDSAANDFKNIIKQSVERARNKSDKKDSSSNDTKTVHWNDL